MIRVVVDTNIAISGYFFGGIPLKIINLAISQRFIWVTSPMLIEEIQRVMRSEKFGLTLEECQKLTQPLLEAADIIKPHHILNGDKTMSGG